MNNATNKSNKKSGVGGTEFRKPAKFGKEDIMKIRLEGYSRFIRFNSWSFRKLSLQETREIALSQIFNLPENFSVDFIRKFEKENNKTKILLQALSKSILDPYRHEYGVLDWTIEKTKNQDLKKDDFNEIMNMTLSEVLKLYENSLL